MKSRKLLEVENDLNRCRSLLNAAWMAYDNLQDRLRMPTASEIRLAAGELTTQEMRTVKAVLRWFIGRVNERV